MRCPWPNNDPLMEKYHDQEWGVPLRRDRKMFEFLVLESAQAGLSWRTVLYKRQGYRQAFADFDPERVARFNQRDFRRLMNNPAIIRNGQKIKAALNNAKRFLEVRNIFGTFTSYLWNYVDGQPVINHWRSDKQIPAVTPLAEKIAKDLKQRGFSFLGSTVVYAHLQATGLVNDHLVSCWRWREVQADNKKPSRRS